MWKAKVPLVAGSAGRLRPAPAATTTAARWQAVRSIGDVGEAAAVHQPMAGGLGQKNHQSSQHTARLSKPRRWPRWQLRVLRSSAGLSASPKANAFLVPTAGVRTLTTAKTRKWYLCPAEPQSPGDSTYRCNT